MSQQQTNARKINIVIRWILFLSGIVLMSLGISIVTHAGLGTTPISTLPLVSSFVTGYTFGQTTFWINMVLVVIQLILLKRFFKLGIFLQIPLTFLFSLGIDMAMPVAKVVEINTYWGAVAFSMLGNAVLGLGVAMEVFSNVLMLPGEGFVLALTIRLNKKFSTMKIVNDVTLVLLAVILSLVCLGGLQGVREGTILSAVTVGLFVKLWMTMLRKIQEKLTPAA